MRNWLRALLGSSESTASPSKTGTSSGKLKDEDVVYVVASPGPGRLFTLTMLTSIEELDRFEGSYVLIATPAWLADLSHQNGHNSWRTILELLQLLTLWAERSSRLAAPSVSDSQGNESEVSVPDSM